MKFEKIPYPILEADQPFEITHIDCTDPDLSRINHIELRGKSGEIFLLSPDLGNCKQKESTERNKIPYDMEFVINIFRVL
jgi:hypothetical protein